MTVAWTVLRSPDKREVHVLPEADADEREHVMGANCWCHPDLERRPGSVLLIVHRDELDREVGALGDGA